MSSIAEPSPPGVSARLPQAGSRSYPALEVAAVPVVCIAVCLMQGSVPC